MSRSVPWEEIPSVGSTLPEDIYNFEIEEMLETETQEAKKYMIKLSARVTEPSTHKGMPFYDQFVIGSESDPEAHDPKTWRESIGAKRWKQILEKAGVPLAGDVEAACARAKGQRFTGHVTCYTEEKEGKYKGQERNRLSRVYAPGEREPGSLSNGKPKAGAGGPSAWRAPKPA